MRNIQTAVSSHPLKIGHMFIWTYLLGIVHTTTSKNIYYSSWNTLYNVINVQQREYTHNFKNIKQKVLKNNVATWLDKMRKITNWYQNLYRVK